MSLQQLSLARIGFDGEVPVTMSQEGDTWWVVSQELGISAFGCTWAEAVDSFYEDFAVFWEAIGQAPDDTLAADALAAKRAASKYRKSKP